MAHRTIQKVVPTLSYASKPRSSHTSGPFFVSLPHPWRSPKRTFERVLYPLASCPLTLYAWSSRLLVVSVRCLDRGAWDKIEGWGGINTCTPRTKNTISTHTRTLSRTFCELILQLGCGEVWVLHNGIR